MKGPIYHLVLARLAPALALSLRDLAEFAERTVTRRVQATRAIFANWCVVPDTEKDFFFFVSRLHGSPITIASLIEQELLLTPVRPLRSITESENAS
jgi:hypothetical protein